GYISKRFPFPDNEKLVALLDKYLKYEVTMTQFKIPENLTTEQRYALIKQKRREIFGGDDANLVFGLEESKVNFNFAYQNFAKTSANTPGDARIAQYEQLRKQT